MSSLNLPLQNFPDTIELTNDRLHLGISPMAGRIVDLRRRGGDNLLWRSTHPLPAEDVIGAYRNLGGDKIWPAVQMMWPRYSPGQWPPDGIIDGRPWRLIDASPQRVTIESEQHPDLQIVARRSVTLDAVAARVVIDSTLTRISQSSLPVCVWSVTQVQRPEVGLMDIADDRVESPAWRYINLTDGTPFPETIVQLANTGRTVAYRPPVKVPGKVGTFGRWLAGVYRDDIFLQQTAFDSAGAYPDRSNVQLFSCERYVEIETLSPQVHLQPGQTLSHRVVWHLLNRAPGSLDAISEQCASWAREQV